MEKDEISCKELLHKGAKRKQKNSWKFPLATYRKNIKTCVNGDNALFLFVSLLISSDIKSAINSIEFLLKRYLVFSSSSIMSAISPRNRKFLGHRAPANAGPPKSGNSAKNAMISLTPNSLSKRSGTMEGIRI